VGNIIGFEGACVQEGDTCVEFEGKVPESIDAGKYKLVIQGAHEESASFYINKVKVKEN
jgi:hypothetical protein